MTPRQKFNKARRLFRAAGLVAPPMSDAYPFPDGERYAYTERIESRGPRFGIVKPPEWCYVHFSDLDAANLICLALKCVGLPYSWDGSIGEAIKVTL